ncbi:MAG: phosphatase PAP2 family protein [Brevibacterium sp.]|nr:phosphatase PAP2 family protein [Brevibacterium sp.]MDN5808069.1 phosphatase PAP2 family protein [Brevibacterium sp.]MDN5833946.1 phosphatase PAP2 family protein [Brevibacterium sp.]MDN5877674.1 phosphatase PAP2 family protein [Brevibacterium sp.]MDN6159191.1 phosphatase PAP2 family protein [Brevibacterium sp.]MDN6175928.1 phosphatase PAP2 family protein [Brevibacterium sp.]
MPPASSSRPCSRESLCPSCSRPWSSGSDPASSSTTLWAIRIPRAIRWPPRHWPRRSHSSPPGRTCSSWQRLPPTSTEAVPTEITPLLRPVQMRFHWSMILAFAWIVLMMWSRTALQVHWLSDTIAGALIGISAAVLADELWTWVTMRTRSPHRRR